MAVDLDKLQKDVKANAAKKPWQTDEPGKAALDKVRSDARYLYLKRLREKQFDAEYAETKDKPKKETK